MIRSAWLLLLLALASSSGAQTADPLDALDALSRQADKAENDWAALAKGLEKKIATLLPCDPKSKAAVEEVSRASDARLAALSKYLKAAIAKAQADTDSAKQVLAVQAAISGGWNTERAEAHLEGTKLEAQIADLKESMRKRGSLAGAEQVLLEIAKMVKERAAKADDQAARKETIDALLGDLVLAYSDRQKTLENELSLLDAETARWNAYYTARLARAVTECTIINAAPAPRKKKP